MSTKFPHMSDTTYPGIDNVNPYETANKFDYSRWNPGTTLKLCNVRWDSDYRNVVKFDDDAARDKWFDALGGETVTIETLYRIMPDGSIKLPLPFDEVARYNYLMVDFSTATGSRALDFETGKGVRRFFFFVTDFSYNAANTTECRLELDEWMTYVNRVTLKNMILERGHAPMAATSASDYLANPLANSRYLLAPDYNYGEATNTANAEWVPFGNGEKYVLVATSIPWERLNNAGLGNLATIGAEGATYYSDAERNGHLANVSGPEYAAGGVGTSGLNLDTKTTQVSGGSIPNANTVFAVRADLCFSAGNFFDVLAARYPQALEAVAGVFVVDEAMIVLGESQTIFTSAKQRLTWAEMAATGKTWAELASTQMSYRLFDDASGQLFAGSESLEYKIYKVAPNNGLIRNIDLKASDFSYPDEYKDLAKLYTSPYACIEVTDDENRTATIRIENTGSLALYRKVSLAYPYLDFTAFLTGVGSDEATTYEWRDVTGATSSETMPWGDFRDYMHSHEIPAYQLYMSGYDKYRLHNYNANNTVPRLNAVTAYENAARSANTAYQNALDSSTAAYDNALTNLENARGNARNGAYAAYMNALDSNATVRENTETSSANTKYVSDNNSAIAYGNATRSAVNSYLISTTSNATGYQNAYDGAVTSYDNAHRSAETGLSTGNASATASKTTGDNSAAAAKTCGDRSATTSRTNSVNSITAARANAQTSITARVADIGYHNAESSAVVYLQNELQVAQQAYNAGYQRAVRDAENTNALIGGALSAASSVGGGALKGALDGGAAGASVGAIGGSVSAVATIANAAIGTWKNTTLCEAAITNSKNILVSTTKNNTDINDKQIVYENKIRDTDTTAAAAVADNNQSTDTTNANNSYELETANNQTNYDTTTANNQTGYDTTTANNQANYATSVANAQASKELTASNALRTRNTADDNATRAKTTAYDNAARTRGGQLLANSRNYDTTATTADLTKATGDGNARRTYENALGIAAANASAAATTANRSREVTRANARYTRDTALDNAARTMATAADVARAGYLDHRLDRAVTVANASGDPVPDEYAWRGMQVRIKTQNAGEIAQAGDMMLRYGYALNQAWQPDNLNVMPAFTYWKCSDLWVIGGDGVIETARRSIRDILTNGTTVWADADKIGEVSIYENH